MTDIEVVEQFQELCAINMRFGNHLSSDTQMHTFPLLPSLYVIGITTQISLDLQTLKCQRKVI